MARLDLELLGPFQVTLDKQPIASFGYEKVRALLTYLAVESNRPHHRDAIAALFWVDRSHEQARSNLRKALSTLRKAVGDQTAKIPFFTIDSHTIQFNRSSDHLLDTATFTALFAETTKHQHIEGELCADCVVQLEQAVALYQGEFLAQFTLRGSTAFEEWAMFVREQMHHKAISACAKLAAYYENQHNWEQTQKYVRRQLALEPWNEAAHMYLMRVLADSGQRGAALQQYKCCCRVLADELGVEPQAETTALYEQIFSGTFLRSIATLAVPETSAYASTLQMHSSQSTVVADTSTASFPVSKPSLYGNLPANVTSLVGREQEIAEACALFQRDDVRLLTLTGTGGTGKTRLALALATVLQVTFADGVWFVALASIRDPMHVIGAIAQTFGVQEAIDEPLFVRLANFLRQRQVLLVLDNFEHILDAATLISDLLAACANLKILVTSRTRLHLYGEWEFFVPQLTLPSCHQYLSCDQALESEAVRLFVARAQAIRRDFTLTNANASVVAEICTKLDGLPLAIELAAMRSNLLDPPVLLKQLDRRLALLVGGPRDFPPRHRTLRAAIGWSYELLPSPQQALFRRLGVFVGGWTLDAAKAVCQKNNDRNPNILDETLALLDCHLLKQECSDNDECRFAMLETIREYALLQLEELDEAAITRQEHATYYLGLAELAELNLQGKEQVMWLQRLNGDHENFRAALKWAFHHGQYEIVARIAGALHHFWNVCSHLSDGSYWLKAALAHRDILSATVLAKVLLGAGVLALRQANFTQAEKLCAESLAIYQQFDNKAGMSKAHNELSLIMLGRSNFSEALLHSEHSVALERELGSVTGIAFALSYSAAPLLYQGKYAQARLLLNEALLLSRESDNIFSTSFCLVGLGQVALASHDYTEAQRFFTEALALCRSLNSREGISWVLEGFAGLAAMQEQPVRAARLYGAAEALREFIGAPLPDYIRNFYESFITAACTQIDKAAFAAIWETGRAISLECAIVEALEEQADTIN